ncbi:hypothetical protein [Limnoglobus roseus]|uniref:Carboxypeptidase regulatory-like domain-containing protein n=1 Tax=Limnoglobus roseus TaxID=2598579 RepID=A0A5C1AD57_9BACT|nr:hypothetical protein [Limnoglobus roseus]QEL15936.1 carboxypeptidase regulatory-like domain-containing protein [Limnoglobus roseus]
MACSLPTGPARLTAGGALVVVFLSLVGCSDGGPKVVPVSGIVTIDGQPLTYGHIQVLPTGWRPASSRIGSDGRFMLTTTVSGDGCAVGTHPVAILAGESISTEATKWHAPKKYADSKTSNLTVTITGPTNDLKVELTWSGGKPFTEKFEREGGTELQGLGK